MRSRRIVAAVVGVSGAAAAHVLDVAGRLPFVHETAAVRDGLSPGAAALWLLVAAVAGACAASRPAVVGAASALLVGALPELAARHDAGAFVEPSAVAGAAVQWLLLLVVIAVAVAVHRRLTARVPAYPFVVPPSVSGARRDRVAHGRRPGRTHPARAPPGQPFHDRVHQRGRACTSLLTVASSRPRWSSRWSSA